MVAYNDFGDPKDFEEIREKMKMNRYANGTIKKLKEMTDAEFHRDVIEELSFFGLNLNDMEKFFYNERNRILELSDKFNKGELKPLSLDYLYDELEALVEHSKTVGCNHKTYSDLTGESCDFYEPNFDS